MARRVNRGELWLYTFKNPDKRRPVLILSRDEVVDLLRTVTVAPVTLAIHGAPSEVLVGPDEGLKHDSAVNLDHLQTVAKDQLGNYIGQVGEAKMREVCKRLGIALGCR